MDLPIVIKVITGEYLHWKNDVYYEMCGLKCGEISLPPVLRYVLIIMGLHPQCNRNFQKQPS